MDTIQLIVLAFAIITFLAIGYLVGKFVEKKRWEAELDSIRAEAIKRSRSVLTGTFSEQIAPYLPGFRYSPTEIRFIGKPVDFIVFEGMDGKEISKITFVEVKSGKANLSSVERSLRDAIQAGKVGWEIYRPPQNKEQ